MNKNKEIVSNGALDMQKGSICDTRNKMLPISIFFLHFYIDLTDYNII